MRVNINEYFDTRRLIYLILCWKYRNNKTNKQRGLFKQTDDMLLKTEPEVTMLRNLKRKKNNKTKNRRIIL